MSISVFNDTKIYVACSAHVTTGGPELLHQLAVSSYKRFKHRSFYVLLQF
jgi:hypothetical protein